ncbi:MAG: hypothetical protein LAP13_00825 [Acidobacteriia bacterium]|nr:hypothetical protein [Terriglobia bacterium]
MYVARRNATFVQMSGLLMLLFSALVVIAAAALIAGRLRSGQPAAQRARPVATTVFLTSAVGFLLSSATLYLTYRPYWYIFQRVILNGDTSQTRDLRDFLMATQVPPGMGSQTYLLWLKFPIYFWIGVTLLGLIGLALIFLRHFQGRPRPRVSG